MNQSMWVWPMCIWNPLDVHSHHLAVPQTLWEVHITRWDVLWGQTRYLSNQHPDFVINQQGRLKKRVQGQAVIFPMENPSPALVLSHLGDKILKAQGFYVSTFLVLCWGEIILEISDSGLVSQILASWWKIWGKTRKFREALGILPLAICKAGRKTGKVLFDRGQNFNMVQ